MGQVKQRDEEVYGRRGRRGRRLVNGLGLNGVIMIIELKMMLLLI